MAEGEKRLRQGRAEPEDHLITIVGKTHGVPEQQGAGYLDYLQRLLAQEVTQRQEHQLQRYLRQAQFPYTKRLEDFDFSAALATELEFAQQHLRLPKLLAQYRRYAHILVDEVGYLPFSQTAAKLLFQFFSDRYERASVAVTSNLDFAHWTEVFGNERMTAALLDRLVRGRHHTSAVSSLSALGSATRPGRPRWLCSHAEATSPPMSLLDTSHLTLEQSVSWTHSWI
jgi:DNA replication protein DnaC